MYNLTESYYYIYIIIAVERGVESYRPAGESRMAVINNEVQMNETAHTELWNVNEDGESLDFERKKTSKKKKKKRSKVHDRIGKFTFVHY